LPGTSWSSRRRTQIIIRTTIIGLSTTLVPNLVRRMVPYPLRRLAPTILGLWVTVRKLLYRLCITPLPSIPTSTNRLPWLRPLPLKACLRGLGPPSLVRSRRQTRSNARACTLGRTALLTRLNHRHLHLHLPPILPSTVRTFLAPMLDQVYNGLAAPRSRTQV